MKRAISQMMGAGAALAVLVLVSFEALAASRETPADKTFDGLAVTSAVDPTVVQSAYLTFLVIGISILMAVLGFLAIRHGVSAFFPEEQITVGMKRERQRASGMSEEEIDDYWRRYEKQYGDYY